MPIRVYLRERPGAVLAFRASTVIAARLDFIREPRP